MNAWKRILLLPIGLLLVSCSTPPDMQDMIVSDAVVTGSPYPAWLQGNVVVTSVAGGEQTNPLWTSEINAEGFKGALIESLRRAGLLSGEGARAGFSLVAVIVNAEQPLVGFDLTVSVTVEYTLIDGESGNETFRQMLTSTYQAKLGQSFLYVERLKMANEGAVRENIRMLLDRLRTLAL